MYTGVAWMVGNLETIICGKWHDLLQLLLCYCQSSLFMAENPFMQQNRDAYKFSYLRKVMLSLLESRRELLGATLTQDQTLELQLKVISKIDWGNRYVSPMKTISCSNWISKRKFYSKIHFIQLQLCSIIYDNIYYYFINYSSSSSIFFFFQFISHHPSFYIHNINHNKSIQTKDREKKIKEIKRFTKEHILIQKWKIHFSLSRHVHAQSVTKFWTFEFLFWDFDPFTICALLADMNMNY